MNKPVMISVKKNGHQYHFIGQTEPLTLKSLLVTADDDRFNLTRNDVIPYIHYLGYSVEQIAATSLQTENNHKQAA